MSMKGIGLCGAHRTGKTTMAVQCAKVYPVTLVETTTSAVFAAHGLSPSEPMDFAKRLWIQGKVLAAAEEIWQQQDALFITDRTPLDMLAYTLADVQGKTSMDATILESYIHRCFSATAIFFSRLLVVQPGIPLIAAQGKAALNVGYIEHLNSLIIGFCGDERQLVAFDVLPRFVIDLDERCVWLANKCSLPVG